MDQVNRTRACSVSLELSVTAACLNARNPDVSFFGATGNPAPTVGGVPGNNMLSPVYLGYSPARPVRPGIGLAAPDDGRDAVQLRGVCPVGCGEEQADRSAR